MDILISVVEDLNQSTSKQALKKWEEHFDKEAGECAFVKCGKEPQGKLTGRFVKRAFGGDRIYIVPVCTKHKNDLNGTPYVKPNTAFFDIND